MYIDNDDSNPLYIVLHLDSQLYGEFYL
jgi:hypothetical protein